MRPLAQLRTVAPETSAVEALELMSREDINQVPVIANGHLEGIFSRGEVLRFLSAAVCRIKRNAKSGVILATPKV